MKQTKIAKVASRSSAVQKSEVRKSEPQEQATPANTNGGTEDPVPELMKLLGNKTVFINWPKGVKGGKLPWKHLTLAHMTPDYLAKLQHGNIGVVLGDPSDGLCVIDCDDEGFATAFAAANPTLVTLVTHGSRGRAYWLKFKGDCPRRSCKLKIGGADVGEFRSNGNQSIVWGDHPTTGRPYQWLTVQPAATVDYDSIVWPDGLIKTPSSTKKRTEGELTITHESLKITNVVNVPSSICSLSVYTAAAVNFTTVKEAVNFSLPIHDRQNNDKVFLLARSMLTVQRHLGRSLTKKELIHAIRLWCDLTQELGFLRETRDHYVAKFFFAWKHVKKEVGRSLDLHKLLRVVDDNPLPPEAELFETTTARRLVGLCYYLQLLAGEEPFFLSCRKAAAVLGVESFTTTAEWLRSMVDVGILVLVSKGLGVKSSRYRYVSGALE